MPLLSVNSLHTTFRFRDGFVRAVNGVSFDVDRGESVGIVGESGCGKSLLCASIPGLLPSRTCAIEQGSIMFDGVDLVACPAKALRQLRGNRITMVFQDPMTSLNPYLRIADQMTEVLTIHRQLHKSEARIQAIESLKMVGVPAPEQRIKQYPHELSGGMRQRVMIATALLTKPDLLIADEPTTALDVTVQAQIIELFRQRQADTGMAIIFVTHNLAVVSSLCDRVMVMYAGKIMESGIPDKLVSHPLHPYTAALIQSIPGRSGRGKVLPSIPGQPPNLSGVIEGCPFTGRCRYVKDICVNTQIVLERIDGDHQSACVRIQNGEINNLL
jgi:oligopeptide transport system ATP-binding protein